jgi:hypothetical protein
MSQRYSVLANNMLFSYKGQFLTYKEALEYVSRQRTVYPYTFTITQERS